jgi:chromosome segregation ATPase
MAGIFSKPISAEKRLAKAKQEHSNAVERLTKTEAAIPQLEATIEQMIKAAAADRELEAAEEALHKARARIISCKNTISGIDDSIHTIEAEIQTAIRQKAADEHANLLDNLSAEAVPVFRQFADVREQVIVLLHRYGEFGCLEAHGPQAFTMNVRALDLALENVVHEAAALARDTRELRRPIVKVPPKLV